jgi:hypothetical protein
LLAATAIVALTFGLARWEFGKDISNYAILFSILAADLGLLVLVAQKAIHFSNSSHSKRNSRYNHLYFLGIFYVPPNSLLQSVGTTNTGVAYLLTNTSCHWRLLDSRIRLFMQKNQAP